MLFEDELVVIGLFFVEDSAEITLPVSMQGPGLIFPAGVTVKTRK